MPAVMPCAPETFRKILERFGYKVYRQDLLNWSMVRGTESPVIIPKKGKVVSLEVQYSVFAQTGLTPGMYLTLKAQIEEELGS